MSFFSTQWKEFRSFWRSSGFPGELKRSTAAFLILMLAGFGICMAEPELLNRIVRFLQEYISGLNLTDNAGNLSALALFSNNAQACAIAMLLGLVPFLYLTALPLGINSMLLGVLAAYYVTSGLPLMGYFAALLPHGIFELPALVLSFSMGLFCCSQVTRRIRKDETALRVWDCLYQMSRVFVLLLVPLLLAAALMESYVTPLIASYFH